MSVFAPHHPLSTARHPELVSGSTVSRGRLVEREAQTNGKVMPIGIGGFNKVDFPLAMPPLELLFAGNGGLHGVKPFIIHQFHHLIALGKAVFRGGTMLPQARNQIGRDTDVERAARLASQDIDAGLAFIRHGPKAMAQWTLKQVQGDEKIQSNSLFQSDLKKAFS